MAYDYKRPQNNARPIILLAIMDSFKRYINTKQMMLGGRLCVVFIYSN